MRASIPLLLSLLLSLALACSKSGSAPESPGREEAPNANSEATEPEDADEPKPVEAPGVVPVGFPYSPMEGDQIRHSRSFWARDTQHYEVAIDSDLAPDAVADFWQAELEKHGVKVSRKQTEAPHFLLVVLEGEDEKGVYSRVSVLKNRATGADEAQAPTKVSVFVGKR